VATEVAVIDSVVVVVAAATEVVAAVVDTAEDRQALSLDLSWLQWIG